MPLSLLPPGEVFPIKLAQAQQTWVIQCPLPSMGQVPPSLPSGVGRAVGGLRCSPSSGLCGSGEGVLRTPRLLLETDFH